MSKQEIPDLSSLMGALSNIATKVNTNNKIEKPTWWNLYMYPESQTINISDLISFTKKALFFQNLNTNDRIYEYNYAGVPGTGPKDSFVEKIIKNIDFKISFECTKHVFDNNHNYEWFLTKSDAAMYIKIHDYWNSKFYYDLNIVSTNKADLDKLKEIKYIPNNQ
jgi:hypothetical protein